MTNNVQQACEALNRKEGAIFIHHFFSCVPEISEQAIVIGENDLIYGGALALRNENCAPPERPPLKKTDR